MIFHLPRLKSGHPTDVTPAAIDSLDRGMIELIRTRSGRARSAFMEMVVAHAGRVDAQLFPIKIGYGDGIRLTHPRRLSRSTSDT